MGTWSLREAGMKVGRIKDACLFGITPPSFIPPLEPFDSFGSQTLSPNWVLVKEFD